ncbi:MAG: hypothetical protein DRO09_03160 [Thermoprotei archaeon]|nr:MAG: hypothetical protein DRO09_03160 [Thermoprotei archaeon]
MSPILSGIDVGVIEELYGIRCVGRLAIAKELASKLNITVRTALRKLQIVNNLSKVKFRLTIEYSLSTLGLKRMLILSNSDEILRSSTPIEEKRPLFIRSYFYLVPRGAGIVLHVPAYSKASHYMCKDCTVFEFHEIMRNATSLSTYGVGSVSDFHIPISEKSFKLLRNSLFSHIEESCESTSLLPSLKVRYDWMDVAIIKEAEKDPLAKLSNIAQQVGIPVSKVRRHAYAHIPFIIRGIRIRYLPIYKYYDSIILVFLKAKSTSCNIGLGEALMKHPLFPMYGVNMKENAAIAQALVPFHMSRKVIGVFEELEKELGVIKVVDVKLATHGRTYTLPYVKWQEYIPKRTWGIPRLGRREGNDGFDAM